MNSHHKEIVILSESAAADESKDAFAFRALYSAR